MGLLVDGQWQDVWYDTKSNNGEFVRSEAQFRNWLSADGSPGPDGQQGFPAETKRYHLYISYACPWAHRVLIYRALKGLEDMIDVSVVHWLMDKDGWTFEKDDAGIVFDKLYNFQFAHQLYTKANPNYTGRVTVPILWDIQQQTIVSNESSEIIRMFNQAFDHLGATPGDYYPKDLRIDIDAWNEKIYHGVNNGVYQCGFATSQTAYQAAAEKLFAALAELDQHLASQRFLLGEQPTEADWRLFPTLFRFDEIYTVHFKCSHRHLIDYKHLWAYARDCYQWPKIAETTNLQHAIHHYYESHTTINPNRIVPLAMNLDWQAPHGRERLSKI